MPPPKHPSTTSPLRRDVYLANWNAALWAAGSGLAPTLLVLYLAMGLGGQGMTISWVIAAPRFAGLLRLWAPSLIDRAGSRKRLCVLTYSASSVVLAALPLVALFASHHSRRAALVSLVVCWALYQVLEYLGTTALWSWLGDLFPPRIRGRLVGGRERWLVLGVVIGMASGFAITADPLGGMLVLSRTQLLGVATIAGAAMMLLAVAPLAAMREAPYCTPPPRQPLITALWHAASQPRFARLLLWSMGLSVANGIGAAARGMYPKQVLGFEYGHLLPLFAGMRVGQSVVAPQAGRWVDRVGPRRVMLLSQAVVCVSPVFFLLATRQAPWWLLAAFAAWVAYGGLNVSLDSMKLALAPGVNTAPAMAVYYAASDVASGTTILLGGLLLQRVLAQGPTDPASYAAPLGLEFLLRVAVAVAVLLLPAGRLRRG